MSAPRGLAAATAGTASWPRTRDSLLQAARRRVRDRGFWNVQLMVLAVTGAHYAMELPPLGDSFVHLHHLPPVLYAFPIIYASLRFGREGGMLTGFLCVAVTLPNIVLWHRHSMEWPVELSQIGTAVVVGLVLSGRVEHEAAERRRAEQMAERLVLVNQQVTRAQEAERMRIARELHDETAQALVALGHRLDGVASTSGLPEQTRRALDDIRAMADTTLAGVRQFSRALRPSILDHLGLVPALDWLTADLSERAALAARFEVSGEKRRLPAETELALFRICQEALRNAEKHSGATAAVVTLAFSDGLVRLTVTDDGSGFDLSASSDRFIRSGQLGIAGMFERAQLIGARLAIDTAPGRGTSVTVTVGE